jgi:hypothetical protein
MDRRLARSSHRTRGALRPGTGPGYAASVVAPGSTSDDAEPFCLVSGVATARDRAVSEERVVVTAIGKSLRARHRHGDAYLVADQRLARTELGLWFLKKATTARRPLAPGTSMTLAVDDPTWRGAAALGSVLDHAHSSASHTKDETLHQLGLALLAAADAPIRCSPAFVTHVAVAVRDRIAASAAPAVVGLREGGLAAWREARAKELLEGHFGRTFRASTGMSPREWLHLRRSERAKPSQP